MPRVLELERHEGVMAQIDQIIPITFKVQNGKISTLNGEHNPAFDALIEQTILPEPEALLREQDTSSVYTLYIDLVIGKNAEGESAVVLRHTVGAG